MQVHLTIGHNVAGVPTLKREQVAAAVASVCKLEACTIIPCWGMWRGEFEESTRIEVCGIDEQEAARIRACVPALAAELNQEAIMCEVRAGAVEFIAA